MERKKKRQNKYHWTNKEDETLKRIFKEKNKYNLDKELPGRSQWAITNRVQKLCLQKRHTKNGRTAHLNKYNKKISDMKDKLLAKNEIHPDDAYRKAKQIIDAQEKQKRILDYEKDDEYMKKVNHVEKIVEICILCRKDNTANYKVDHCISCLEKLETHEQTKLVGILPKRL